MECTQIGYGCMLRGSIDMGLIKTRTSAALSALSMSDVDIWDLRAPRLARETATCDLRPGDPLPANMDRPDPGGRNERPEKRTELS